jgi:HK97 family phage major capsid protein
MPRKAHPAQERLLRNQREALETQAEYRDVTSGDPGATGFIPPLYLAAEWAELARPARPFANAIPNRPLPVGGLTLTIPKVQTGVTVASQSSEGSAVSETDLDSQTVTASVVTIAGQDDISLQALERSAPGMDEVIFGDLKAVYDAELDRQLIEGTGTGGTHTGLANVSGRNARSYTAGTPTGAGLLPVVYGAISDVASNRYRTPDLIVMHGRRGAWLSKETLSSASPLFQQGQLFQAFGQQAGGFLQTFAGCR